MPLEPGTPRRDNGRRLKFDDTHFYTRDLIRTSGPTQGWRVGQYFENLAFADQDLEDQIMTGWVATPYSAASDLAEEITFDVESVTAGLDAFTEFKLVASEDVSAWLTVGMRISWAVWPALPSLTTVAVVTTVNGANVWAVGPIGGGVPSGLDLLLYISSAAYPSGLPSDDASWSYTWSSPYDSNGWATGTTVAVDVASGDLNADGNKYKSPSSTMQVNIPGGPFELSFETQVEGTRAAAGTITLIAGLAQVGNAKPYGGLEGRIAIGPVTTIRQVLRNSKRRYLINSGAPHKWVMSCGDANSTSTMAIRNDIHPTFITARLRYNDV